jgi:hypothetical protein
MDPDLLLEEVATSGRTVGDEPDSAVSARMAAWEKRIGLLVEQADGFAVLVPGRRQRASSPGSPAARKPSPV